MEYLNLFLKLKARLALAFISNFSQLSWKLLSSLGNCYLFIFIFLIFFPEDLCLVTKQNQMKFHVSP